MSGKPTSEEKKILKAVRSKGEAGWQLLFDTYDPIIEGIVRWRYNFTKEAQQDVCQNIRKHLLTAIPRFKNESTLSWYIKRITMNECVNEIRRQSRTREFITTLVQPDINGKYQEREFSNPDALNARQQLIKAERIEMVRIALQALQKICQESIIMFHLKQMSYQDISERLGIAQNTVGSRLAKCREKMHIEIRKLTQYERTRS